MKVGLFTRQHVIGWEALRDTWRLADRSGYDSVWLNDHLVPRNLDDAVLEAWTLLAALAPMTERIRVGQLVTANTFRHPAVLAKMAVTVDHTCGGRLIVGLGAGYFDLDHTLYGLPFPGKRERGEMLAEACQILKGLWREDRFSFAGEHYTLTDAPAEPRPVQPGGPPLLVGGGGERSLRTAARYADQWNLPDGTRGITTDDFRRKHAILRRNCEEIGRDPAEIETNTSLVVIVGEDEADVRRRYAELSEQRRYDEETAARHIIAGTPDQVAEQLAAWEEAGLDHFLIHLVPGINYDDVVLFAATVLPQIR